MCDRSIRSPEGNVPQSSEIGGTEQVIKQDETPDEFEYSLTQDDKKRWRIVVENGCPHCGHEKVFVTEFTLKAQSVSYETDEEGNEILGPDDVLEAELSFVRCNNCWEVLINKSNSR